MYNVYSFFLFYFFKTKLASSQRICLFRLCIVTLVHIITKLFLDSLWKAHIQQLYTSKFYSVKRKWFHTKGLHNDVDTALWFEDEIANIKRQIRHYQRNRTHIISNKKKKKERKKLTIARDSVSQSRSSQSPVERDATSAGLSTGDWWPQSANQRPCYSKVVNPRQ